MSIIERATALPKFDAPEQGREWTDYHRVAWYQRVIDVVGDDRQLVWGTMVYACQGVKGTPARPVPPDWDKIVSGAPKGYWEKRGGVPEIVDGTFPAIAGRPSCGFEHRVWMGVGVEGPPALKEADATIPSPFYCGRCACGSGLAHVRWRDDEEFDDLRPIPAGVPRFLVPSIEKAREYVADGYGGAEYVEPAGEPGSVAA